MLRFGFPLALLLSCGGAPPHAEEPRPLPRVEQSSAARVEPQGESACAEQIPNTTVCDNAKTREVLAFCERYRTAMEARDAAALVELASPRYSDGDVDYAQLKAKMDALMQKVQSVRYEINYRKVTFRPDDTIAVDYNYAASFRLGTEWKHSVADNTLVLEHTGSRFLILRGM